MPTQKSRKPTTVTDFRLETLETRLKEFDQKLDSVIAKLGELSEAQIKANSPEAYILLKEQMTATTIALTRLNEKLNDVEEEVDGIKRWRSWVVGGATAVIGILAILADEIKIALFK